MTDQSKLSEYWEVKKLGKANPKNVKVVIKPMDKALARQLFPYRPSNKDSESRFGGDYLMDDTALLLNDLARRCKMCQAVTKIDYLRRESGTCPDCDGRSEYNGTDPHKKITD